MFGRQNHFCLARRFTIPARAGCAGKLFYAGRKSPLQLLLQVTSSDCYCRASHERADRLFTIDCLSVGCWCCAGTIHIASGRCPLLKHLKSLQNCAFVVFALPSPNSFLPEPASHTPRYLNPVKGWSLTDCYLNGLHRMLSVRCWICDVNLQCTFSRWRTDHRFKVKG